MTPAHPPLPTPANLPFHFSSGSQTSKRICESLVGAITPATRQNGGRFAIGLVEPVGVNVPDVTGWAAVIVVSGSFCSTRLAHAAFDAVCADARVLKEQKARASSRTGRAGDLMIQPPWTSGASVRADPERTVSKHGRARQVASRVRPLTMAKSRGNKELPARQRWRPLREMCDLEGCGSVMYEEGNAGSLRSGQRQPGRTGA